MTIKMSFKKLLLGAALTLYVGCAHTKNQSNQLVQTTDNFCDNYNKGISYFKRGNIDLSFDHLMRAKLIYDDIQDKSSIECILSKRELAYAIDRTTHYIRNRKK